MEKDKEQIEESNDSKDICDEYKPMTDKEIKNLADDIYKCLVFTDRHIDNVNDVSSVFLPLALMGKDLIDKLQKNPPGMIYEYIDKAVPMSINGMPIFFSFKIASVEDAKKVFERYKKIKNAVANVQ